MTDQQVPAAAIPSPRGAGTAAPVGADAGRVSEPTAWLGWVWFAAMVLIMVGVFNLIDGLVAVFNADYFVQSPAGPLILNITAWGWVHAVLGALQLAAGGSLLTGARWAIAVAVVLTFVNAVTQLLSVPIYPFWAMLVIVLDVLVIWALLVHGREARIVADAGI